MNVQRFAGSCNAYLIGNILIDAPYGTELPSPGTVVITHEHCDHFAGLSKLDGKKAASQFCADVITGKQEEFGMCADLSMDFPETGLERILEEGDKVDGDGFELQTLHTPGHAKGAICLYEPDKKLLFSGDSVFPDFGMPNCNLPSSEPEKLISTYERLAQLEAEAIFPGHGPEIKEKGYVQKLLDMLKGRIRLPSD